MWPYWLLFLVPAYWAVTRLKPTPKMAQNAQRDHFPPVWRGIFILLVLMIGFRHEVGGDWSTYIEHVQRLSDASITKALSAKDPAYGFLNWLAAKSGAGVYFVNLLCAVLVSWGLIVFCRVQPRPWLALVVAVPYLITVVAMGYTRQGVAIGVAMLGMMALGQGSVLRFVLWIVLAAVFHKSALVLIPLALLAGSRRRLFTLIWVAVAGIALFVLLLQESADSLVSGYIEAEYQSSGAAIRVAMNALPAALFLIFKNRFQLSEYERTFWTSMSWTALLFLVLLKVSPSSTAVDRLALYWIPLQLFVLSRLPNALGQRDGKNAMWVYSVVAYSATVHFIWLAYADTAFAWLPYQFYPWVWLWQ
jgi:hypothetical protein